MTTLRPILLTAMIASLAGCAGEPPPAALEKTPESAAEKPTDLSSWTGVWQVTDQFGSAQPLVPAAALMGQKLRLEPQLATDLKGRTCDTPGYRDDRLTEAAFLHLSGPVAESEHMKRMLPRLTVHCGDAPFGQYVLWSDGGLLTAEAGHLLRLARLSEAAAKETPAPPPPTMGLLQPAEKPGRMVYLASYRDEATARHGWDELKHQAPLLAKAEPAMTKVTLPGQGNFLRLQAKGLSEADGVSLCRSLHAVLPDCGAKGRD